MKLAIQIGIGFTLILLATETDLINLGLSPDVLYGLMDTSIVITSILSLIKLK